MKWAEAEAQVKAQEARSNSGELFVRLKDDGDKVRVVLVGEPEPRKVYWDGARMVDWTPDCGERPKTRWLINAYDVDRRSMLILEAGAQLFRTLASVREKFPFEEWILEIKRNGRAGDTKTTYSVLPDKQLSPASRDIIGKAAPNDLLAFTGGGSTYLKAPPGTIAEAVRSEFQDDDLPF